MPVTRKSCQNATFIQKICTFNVDEMDYSSVSTSSSTDNTSSSVTSATLIGVIFAPTYASKQVTIPKLKKPTLLMSALDNIVKCPLGLINCFVNTEKVHSAS
jgi:hypothetical protein